jgi:Pol polyprotein, beta-barrel domain
VDKIFKNSVFSSTSFPLRDLTILDSGTTIHVFNNLSRFSNFRKAPCGDYLIAGRSEVPILGYGDVTLQLKNPETQECGIQSSTFLQHFTLRMTWSCFASTIQIRYTVEYTEGIQTRVQSVEELSSISERRRSIVAVTEQAGAFYYP